MDVFREIKRIVCCFSTLLKVRCGERACLRFSDENKAHYIRLKYIIFCVIYDLFTRVKLQRDTIYAIPLTSRCRAIVKNMPQMRITVFAQNFSAYHAM